MRDSVSDVSRLPVSSPSSSSSSSSSPAAAAAAAAAGESQESQLSDEDLQLVISITSLLVVFLDKL